MNREEKIIKLRSLFYQNFLKKDHHSMIIDLIRISKLLTPLHSKGSLNADYIKTLSCDQVDLALLLTDYKNISLISSDIDNQIFWNLLNNRYGIKSKKITNNSLRVVYKKESKILGENLVNYYENLNKIDKRGQFNKQLHFYIVGTHLGYPKKDILFAMDIEKIKKWKEQSHKGLLISIL